MGHFLLLSPVLSCGRGGMADAPDLGSGVERRKSSSLFVRTVSRFPRYAVVAQLVECHLAKVDVAGPSPVYRSTRGCSSMVELQPSKLVTWVRFPSPAHKKRPMQTHRSIFYAFFISQDGSGPFRPSPLPDSPAGQTRKWCPFLPRSARRNPPRAFPGCRGRCSGPGRCRSRRGGGSPGCGNTGPR